MRTVTLAELKANPGIVQEISETLRQERIICIPSPSGYKLMAALESPAAVTALLQAKCRMKNAPALVFIPDSSWVDRLAADVSENARRLIHAFWPGPVTLLFKASEDLHPKVRKALTKAKGWLGMRVPEDSLSRQIVKRFGGPVLVSSANLSSRKGAQSVAQVKKNFGRTLEVLVDAGDITVSHNSTLVDVSEDPISIVRPGSVDPNRILGALAG